MGNLFSSESTQHGQTHEQLLTVAVNKIFSDNGMNDFDTESRIAFCQKEAKTIWEEYVDPKSAFKFGAFKLTLRMNINKYLKCDYPDHLPFFERILTMLEVEKERSLLRRQMMELIDSTTNLNELALLCFLLEEKSEEWTDNGTRLNSMSASRNLSI